ncbi:unnamed protein product [Chrysoparadoxa australica]
MRKSLYYLLFLILFFGCGQDPTTETITVNDGQSDEILNILFQSMKNFEAQDFYEEGATPYTGNTAGGKPIWGFFEKNVSNALKASDRGVQLIVPKDLAGMNNIGAKGKTSWTSTDIYNLAQGYGSSSTSDKGVLKVFFLKGVFANSEGNQPGVLGVQLSNTMVVAIFKDNIEAIRSSQGLTVARFSEQAVLIHEFGHALGLVNNGITPQSDHHDSSHGSHCTQKSCVMYYLNEGSTDLGEFIRNYILTGDEDLFGNQCLQDLHSKIQ